MEREKPEKNKDPSSYIGLSAKKRKIAGSPEKKKPEEFFSGFFRYFFVFGIFMIVTLLFQKRRDI